jgi:regulator of protease activity HflC (stomatin/prohibitin superfamily)
MILLCLIGIGLFVVARALPGNAPAAARAGLTLAGILAFVVGIGAATVRQVDAGEVGVVKLFGSVRNDVLPSGLHVVNPLADVIPVDVKTHAYTMSRVPDEGEKGGDDAIRVLTSDGLEVAIDVTVLYKALAAEAPRMLREVGPNYEEVLVRPLARTRFRDNAVAFSAVDLYSAKREVFQQSVFAALDADFKSKGLVLEQVLVRDIVLPDSVKLAIEAKINAEQESQKMQFVLDKERQEADRKRVEAQGIADSQRIVAESLSPQLLQYEQIKAFKDLAASPNAKLVLTDGRTATLLQP